MEIENIEARPRFCVVTYFKKRAVKQLFQWLIVSVAALFIISMFAVSDAYAAYICTDIGGAGTIVGSGDSGTVNFDLEPPSSTYAGELCGDFSSVQDYELQGWVWDENLGWISLYCDGGFNNTLACGSVDYGVKIDYQTGEMSGWGWGDNIGWISFGCESGLNEGSACGGINYSGTGSIDVDANLGDISGWAWADTVGWFNLDGISARMLPLVVKESGSETNWGMWTKAENGTLAEGNANRDNIPDKTNSPTADGNQEYDIFVHIADVNGNPVTDPAVTIDLNTDWIDTVQWDQTISDPAVDYCDPVCNNNGPTYKPLNLTSTSGKSTTGGISGSYYGSLRSYAPTSNLNCYDEDGNDVCSDPDDFYYKNFGSGVPTSNLQYFGVTGSITLDHGGGDLEVMPVALKNPFGNTNMDFLPFVELTTFDFLTDAEDVGSGVNYIESFRNRADTFHTIGAERGVTPPYFIALNLIPGDPLVTYGWIDALDSDPPEAGDDLKKIGTVTSLGKLHLALPFAPDSPLLKQISGSKAYSTVSAKVSHPVTGNQTVKFFSNGVPRTSDSTIINQAAEILSGQVYSPGATQVTQNIVITTIGNLATNQLRNGILENVSRIKAGAQIADLSGEKVSLGKGSKVSELAGKKVFYYSNPDLYINKAGLDWALNEAKDEPFTIINEGGDIFISENIELKSPVGIIALADFNATDEEDKGGRIYVESGVTDMVDVYVYSDGPVFRYKDGVCYYWGSYSGNPALDGLREPNFVQSSGRCSSGGSYFDPVANLNNQFYFKGTLASENCIGCAALTDVYRGDGKQIGTPNALNFAISRLYDLNYFGYFRIMIDGSDSGARSNNLDPLTQHGPVYFEYSAPPNNLPGFN